MTTDIYKFYRWTLSLIPKLNCIAKRHQVHFKLSQYHHSLDSLRLSKLWSTSHTGFNNNSNWKRKYVSWCGISLPHANFPANIIRPRSPTFMWACTCKCTTDKKERKEQKDHHSWGRYSLCRKDRYSNSSETWDMKINQETRNSESDKILPEQSILQTPREAYNKSLEFS